MTDGHHLKHWVNGGATTLENTCLLCPSHHTLAHEGGWRLARLPDGALRFIRPDGTELAPAPPRVGLGPDPVEELRRVHSSLDLDGATGLPTWDGAPVDYEWGARALRRLAGLAAP